MKRRQFYFISVTFLIVLFLGVCFLSFNTELNSHIYNDVEKRLQDTAEPNIVSFHLQMHEQIKKVNTFAAFLGENWDSEKEVHRSLLRAAVENNGLLRCAIAYSDGSFITHDDKNDGNVSTEPFFIANMKNEFFITDPRPAVVDPSKRVILLAAPILNHENQVVGSIIYSYLCNDMDQIFTLKSMDGNMNMIVTKQTGNILIGESEYDDPEIGLLEALRQKCTHKMHPAEECLTLSGSSGTYLITSGDMKQNIYLRYDKLEFNDWYMISTISEEAANAGIAVAINKQQSLNSLIAVATLIYIGFILALLLMQRKMVDPATGALTLYAFKKKSKKIFQNRNNSNYVVVKLDVKDFKLINRIHSFATGDKIIKSIAEALTAVLDEGSIFARMGVDIFVLLLPYRGYDALNAKRQEFIHRFQMLMDDNFSTKITFPTGQYVLQTSDYPKPDMEEILEKVNFAHRAAKQNSDVIIDYVSDIESTALFEKKVEDRMENAIRDGEFTLYLQPKVLLSSETVCGAEALVRWKINGKYYMYPTDFVPLFEKNGFIVQLDKYMFKRAVQFVRECLDEHIEPIPVSVNFSRHHLNNENFVDELCQIADEQRVPRKYFEIELTESTFLGNIRTIAQLIERIHQEGFSISMDDFGSGYSCFAQLKDLKIDVLKMDKGFFSRSEDEDRAEVVIAGMLKIAQQLNITTVAEGIERKSQVDMLKSLGCDIIQGYYYAKPMPAEQLKDKNFSIDISGQDKDEMSVK